MSKKYVILDSDEVPDIVFSEVFETSADTLSYNSSGTQTFVKYEGANPRFLYGKDTYTHSEIMAILATSPWNIPMPDED